MKTKLITALFLLLPIGLFSQNYEKEGDDLFAQAQYEQAEKKYKAAVALVGESQTIKQKQDKCTKCKSLLTKAQTAEKESRYSDAAKHYSSLYAIHALAKYQSKANALKQKIQKLEQQRLAKEQARLAKLAEEKRVERERQAKLEEEERAKLKGYCGNNISYEYYAGKLTISGRGEMNNFSVLKDIPWYGRKDEIKTILISDGIRSIADCAFIGCTNLTSVSIPKSVTRIGNYAFADCSSLQTIYIPNNVDKIGEGAFNRCHNLSIKLPLKFKYVVNVFGCTNLTYYSNEKDIQHSTDLKQNHTREEDKIRYTNLSDVDFLKNNDGTVYYPQRKVFVKRLRFNYNLIGSNQYCFITLKSDSDPNYIERFAIPGDQYGKAGNINTLKAKCRCVGNNIYEYTITQVQDAYLYHIQKNVVIGAYEILE